MIRPIGLVIGALLLAGAAVAQQLPGVVGHPENALILTDPTKSAGGNYKLDPGHTSVVGRVLHGKTSWYTFRFNKIDGSYTYDPANPEATKVDVTIDPASIDSNFPRFDKRLAGPDFLDSEKYKAIHFVSAGITRTDVNHGTMTGMLSFHGVTKPVTLNVTFNGGGPVGRRITMGYSATATLNMPEYGMDIAPHNISDNVALTIETEFTNQDVKTDVERVRQLQTQPRE
jgi:polyisoprenoid-binding protein YceI